MQNIAAASLTISQFLLNTNTGDDQGSGGSDESHSCIHTGVGFK